jgi:branched-chain amino acid transport system permease protein
MRAPWQRLATAWNGAPHLSRVRAPWQQLSERWHETPWLRRGAVLLLIVVAFLYPLTTSSVGVDNATLPEVYVLLALGLNVVVGFAGLLDLGYAAFFAIGAYTTALLASSHFGVGHHTYSNLLFSIGPGGIHVNIFLLIPVAAVVAAFFGILFGAPTLRLRGDYLAIVTLGFGEIVPKVIENLGPANSLGLPNITNGVNNITGIDSPPNINIGAIHWTFQTNDPKPWYYLGLIIVIISVVIVYRLRDSRLGRSWVAIREDEIAAAHAGINITGTRLTAFALGAAFSGFGGLLEASRLASVSYDEFLFTVSVTILVMVILGGIGSIPGVILGGIVIGYLNQSWLSSVADYIHSLGSSLHSGPGPISSIGAWMEGLPVLTAKPMIFGFILVGIMLLRPQGLWPERRRARELHPETEQALEEEQAELYTVRTGEI